MLIFFWKQREDPSAGQSNQAGKVKTNQGVKTGVKNGGRGTGPRKKREREKKNHPEIPDETFLKKRAPILTSSRSTPRKLSSLKADWHRIPNN